MSHVDEGALHAYLDGALDEYPPADARRVRDHLESCPQCAIRLEAARRTRQEATAILELAAPSVDAPSFEELRAYVKATRPASSPGALRLYRLGWAASVLVALGVGWMVRGGQLERAASDAAGESFVVPVAPAAEGASPAAPAAREQAPPDAAEAPERQRRSAAIGLQSVPRDATPGEPAADPAAQAAAVDDARKAEEEATEAAAEVAPTGGAAGLPDWDQAALRLEEIVVTGVSNADLLDSSAARANEARADGGVSAPASVVADLPLERARAAGDTVVPGRAEREPNQAGARSAPADETPRRAVEPPAPTAARIDVAASREAVAARPPESAEAEVDEPPLVVPGLEVVSFANLVEGTAPGGLHIVQRLPDGGIVDVYHLPEGVDPSVLPEPGEGRTEVRGEREGQWIVLRGALTTEALGELLARLGSSR